MNPIRADREEDRRVAAAVAAIVLLMLVVAGIVAVGAMAYRDDGKGGLLGTKKSSFSWPVNLQAVITQVTNGGGGMPAFSGTLTDQQIRDLAAFVTSRVAK